MTLQELIAAYENDSDSPRRKLRYSTKQNYSGLTRRLVNEFDPYELSTLNARTLLRWHEGWAADGKVAMGHSMIGMIRTLINFGATILEDKDCERISQVLHKMRFEMGKARTSAMTAEQVIAVRQRAHVLGVHSIALAQAFQFECTLRQKDVIGELIPLTEKGDDTLVFDDLKWLHGLRWQEIDENLVLHHVTSKRGKLIEPPLLRAPMVIEELNHTYPGCVLQTEVIDPNTQKPYVETIIHRELLPQAGPVIWCETMNRPWTAVGFRRMWRRIADEVGIPKAVFNMDTRAGAITEALQSGAGLDAVRKSATHSNASMTQRYSRGDADDIADVMEMRAASRKTVA